MTPSDFDGQTPAEIEHARRLVAEEQLALLLGKLAPHMVGNTLASLSALIAVDAAAAQKMVAQLASFLCSAVATCGDSMRTLEEEFRCVSDFLGIMKVRMGSRLDCQLSLPDSLRATFVPAGLIQVLAENAITHGIETVCGPGSISISARKTGSHVLVECRNTGTGMTDSEQIREGHGLRYVRRRLVEVYGGQAQFRLGPVAGESTVVAEMKLPWAAEAKVAA